MLLPTLSLPLSFSFRLPLSSFLFFHYLGCNLRNEALKTYEKASMLFIFFLSFLLIFLLKFFACDCEIDHSEYNISVQEPILIKSRVGSRYARSGSYLVFILMDKSKEGRECIVEYYCQCLVGSRTLGCCCHVMAIIWYITWARSTNRIRGPADWLDNFALRCENEN